MPDLMVVQLLDNNAYYCLGEDGTLSLPGKLLDGKYHVVGELRVASKEQTRALLKLAAPILKSCPGVKKVLVSCIPRYTASRCCADSGHLTGGENGLARVLTDLAAMRRTARSFLFTERLSNVQIVDPPQLSVLLRIRCPTRTLCIWCRAV